MQVIVVMLGGQVHSPAYQQVVVVVEQTKVGQAVPPGVSSSDVHSGGESPLWTVMTGTIRLSKGARREAGSEESR